ncbi:MAG: TolC family protein [Acidobacteriia bacterium]|nr:TolC family protein [Terriglobia bacterium]
MIAASTALLAQQPAPPAGLSIAQAVEAALRNYPSIRVTQEQMNAAAAGIRLAQTAYLPRIDGLAQVNRATRNNVFGLLLPQSVVPSISGPVLGSNNLGTAWGSAVGVLVSWQPFDFGLRRANVAASTAVRDQTQATVNRTRYDVSVATADTFLTVIAAQQTTQAARAAVDSWQVLLQSIHALVAAQLRPGADESRVEAELAAAKTQLAQSEQAIEVARANLAQFVGLDPSQLALEPGKIVNRLPRETPPAALNAAANPLALEQNAAIASAQARLQAVERTDYPQFFVQGSASTRGTGAELDGARLGGLNGLAPATQNYAIGLTVVFPFMDRFAIREQEAAQVATLRAVQARYQLIATNLQAQFNIALATLTGARRVAANTAVEASAAQTALGQATARYQAGLAPIDDVAQAQRLLVQAQIDDALARLSVWRAALEVETARGDIQPFLAEATQ